MALSFARITFLGRPEICRPSILLGVIPSITSRLAPLSPNNAKSVSVSIPESSPFDFVYIPQ